MHLKKQTSCIRHGHTAETCSAKFLKYDCLLLCLWDAQEVGKKTDETYAQVLERAQRTGRPITARLGISAQPGPQIQRVCQPPT
jgi:hypothetical protein